MTFSYKAFNQAMVFKKTLKLVKNVYYMYKPDNDCTYYYADEQTALQWINEKLKTNYKITLKKSLLSLDYLILYPEKTIHIDDYLWIMDTLLISDISIIIPAAQNTSIIIIYQTETVDKLLKLGNNMIKLYDKLDDNYHTSKLIKFIGPVPVLSSYTQINDITCFVRVVISNMKAIITTDTTSFTTSFAGSTGSTGSTVSTCSIGSTNSSINNIDLTNNMFTTSEAGSTGSKAGTIMVDKYVILIKEKTYRIRI